MSNQPPVIHQMYLNLHKELPDNLLVVVVVVFYASRVGKK
jgi:hypothetical protein